MTKLMISYSFPTYMEVIQAMVVKAWQRRLAWNGGSHYPLMLTKAWIGFIPESSSHCF